MAPRTSLTARSFHCGLTIFISFLHVCYDWKLREIKIGINNRHKRELRKFHNLIIMMSAQLHPWTKVVLCTLDGWIVWHVNCTPMKLLVKKKVGSCRFDGIMHHSSPECFQHSAQLSVSWKIKSAKLNFLLTVYPVSPHLSHSLMYSFLLPIFQAFKIRFLNVFV